MKKLVKVVLILFIFVSIVGCRKEEKQEIVKNYLDSFNSKYIFSEVTEGSYALPITSFNITYESNTERIWFENGRMFVGDNQNEEDINGVVTAKTTINGEEYTKEFNVLVRGNNRDKELRDVLDRITNYLNYYLSESDYLPTNIYGIRINYKVIKGNAEFINNHLVKTRNAKEKEEIEIEVAIDDSVIVTKKILLLDEYYGYLLVSFDGDDGWPKHKTGDEYIYLSISKDKTNWQRLNNEPIITCEQGTNRFRDPFIGRTKDGSFLITATEGFYNPSMYISESNDLINFNTKRISFNKKNELIGLNGDYAWAPEFVYDQIDDKYTIIYSDPSDECKGLYAVDTKDLITFSEPYIYLNTGYNTIDGNVALLDGLYYLFYKDEREGKKNIHYAISHSINNPNWRIVDEVKLNPDSESEGPFAYHDTKDNKNYLMFDSYNTRHTYVGEIGRFSETIWSYPEPQDYWIRHFSIIELTKKEYERLEEAYLK